MEENKPVGKAVYKAIVAVQSDMALLGISKDSENTQQHYKFRGIDAVYNALAPLLAKHKLCIIPRGQVSGRTERESKSGGALFSVAVDMEYDIICSEDGSCHTARMPGEAMDSADKATNKGVSASYKYLCFIMFCIPTEGESPDADEKTHEVKGKAQGGDQRNLLVTKIKEITPTNSPKFFTLITTEGQKMGVGDPDLIAIANEVIKTGEDVRLHFEVNGRFTDVTDIERRAPDPAPVAAAPAPAKRTGPVPAAPKHDPHQMAPMAPSAGNRMAVGVIQDQLKTAASGHHGWTIENQQKEDGSYMKFATKDTVLIEKMEMGFKAKNRVRVEYKPAPKPGTANIIVGVKPEPSDEIPY